MLRLAPGPPVDYGLCGQVVTLYHPLGRGAGFACARTVFRGAFLEWRLSETQDRVGGWQAESFLLVLPNGWNGRPVWAPPREYEALEAPARAGRFTLAPGDKLLEGEGPAIESREAWAALTPAARPGLLVVKEVEPKTFGGGVCHIEGGAGRWRRRAGVTGRGQGAYLR